MHSRCCAFRQSSSSTIDLLLPPDRSGLPRAPSKQSIARAKDSARRPVRTVSRYRGCVSRSLSLQGEKERERERAPFMIYDLRLMIMLAQSFAIRHQFAPMMNSANSTEHSSHDGSARVNNCPALARVINESVAKNRKPVAMVLESARGRVLARRPHELTWSAVRTMPQTGGVW